MRASERQSSSVERRPAMQTPSTGPTSHGNPVAGPADPRPSIYNNINAGDIGHRHVVSGDRVGNLSTVSSAGGERGSKLRPEDRNRMLSLFLPAKMETTPVQDALVDHFSFLQSRPKATLDKLTEGINMCKWHSSALLDIMI
jgi:hypothetical protein